MMVYMKIVVIVVIVVISDVKFQFVAPQARSNIGSAADHSRYCAETRVCGGVPTDTPALCNVR